MMKLIVDVKVENLERAVAFYTKTLGLECRVHEEKWAGIKIGDAEIHLYKDAGVTNCVEFYVENIEEKVKELHKKGVEFVSGIEKPDSVGVDENNITTFPWGRLAFFIDSEGNELALVEDS